MTRLAARRDRPTDRGSGMATDAPPVESLDTVSSRRDALSALACALPAAKDVLSLRGTSRTLYDAMGAVAQDWLDQERGAPLAANPELPPSSQICCGPHAAICALVRRARLEDHRPLALVVTMDADGGARECDNLRGATMSEGMVLTSSAIGFTEAPAPVRVARDGPPVTEGSSAGPHSSNW